ncbi:hypothetical protein Xen7305DRAFT_00046680 [Xenococcus sp. PCC 7305]|uniref:hypothetical protein n=1 Tax=Xenococcus sp. PCC 7305 TaxID=102125 RepID=UPI0002ACDC88|nr:hypothetical protein [Xenococcus sp. PCC 7305]ELS04932.1 hypothetical protein Xen7305DRAFT_00046680 [Xenococcus sp. PCC 7305]
MTEEFDTTSTKHSQWQYFDLDLITEIRSHKSKRLVQITLKNELGLIIHNDEADLFVNLLRRAQQE